jgi:CBS domain-containing protein
MRCANVMKMDVKFVRDDDTVLRAAQIMRDHDLQFLPVVDLDMHVLGIITDRDIALRIASEDRRSSACLISDVRSSEVPSCSPDDLLEDAELQMDEHRKNRILIVDDHGVLCGAISRQDLKPTDDYDRSVLMTLRFSQREAGLN